MANIICKYQKYIYFPVVLRIEYKCENKYNDHYIRTLYINVSLLGLKSFKCHELIVYCLTKVENELFKSWAADTVRAVGIGCISHNTENAFSHAPHIQFFVTPQLLSHWSSLRFVHERREYYYYIQFEKKI